MNALHLGSLNVPTCSMIEHMYNSSLKKLDVNYYSSNHILLHCDISPSCQVIFKAAYHAKMHTVKGYFTIYTKQRSVSCVKTSSVRL
jgi:hypothetical protein